MDTKTFLQQYRNKGLPGAKKFRRRARIAQLQYENGFFKNMVGRGAHLNGLLLHTLQEIIKEENWAVRGEDVLWVGDDQPLENARKLISEATASRQLQPLETQTLPTSTQGVAA